MKELLDIISRRRWIIVIVFVAGVAASGIFSLFMKPVYQSSLTVSVGSLTPPPGVAAKESPYYSPAENYLYWSTVQDKFSQDYIAMIRSETFAEKVMRAVNLPFEKSDLVKKIDANIVKGTPFIDINVFDGDPKTAFLISNAIPKAIEKYVSELGGSKVPGPATPGAKTYEVIVKSRKINVGVLNRPSEPIAPVKPNIVANLMAAAIISLAIGIGLAFLFEIPKSK